jgi:NTE family protein
MMHRELPLLHKKPGTALVLSGGATKAFYFHIGALKVLNLHDINSIVGTSAGAIVGGLIASGVSVDTVIASLNQKELYAPHFKKVIKKFTSTSLFKPNLSHLAIQGFFTTLAGVKFMLALPSLYHKQDIVAEFLDRLILSQQHATGFFDASELEILFKEILPSNDFSKTNIDLYVVATSLDRQERAVFNGLYDFKDPNNQFMTNVPIHKAVRASMSIPGMFDPVKINGKYYIDGEVKQTLSMDIGLALADRVIISHTYHPLFLPEAASVRDSGWLNILKQALQIAFYERISVWRDIYAQTYPEKQFIWIEPEEDDIHFFLAPEFSFRPEVQREMIRSGERAALRALSKLEVSP